MSTNDKPKMVPVREKTHTEVKTEASKRGLTLTVAAEQAFGVWLKTPAKKFLPSN